MKITLTNGHEIIAEKYIESDVVIVGRSRQCDLVVNIESFSRQHCRIEFLNGDFFLTDLDSSNGVYIQGDRIPPHTRTLFRPFQQASISRYELIVSDVHITRSSFKPIDRSALGATSTNTKQLGKTEFAKARKRMDLHPPKKPKYKRNEKQSELPLRISLLVSVVIFAFIVAYLFTQVKESKESIQGSTPEIEKPVRKKFRAVDDFFTTAEYRANIGQSECVENKVHCNELQLKPDHGEGITANEHSLFIFYRPGVHTDEHLWPKVKDNADGPILVMMNLLLRSTIISSYHSETIEHIHLVQLDDSRTPIKVFRLHQRSFSLRKLRLSALLDASARAIEANDSALFWAVTGGQLPSKELIH